MAWGTPKTWAFEETPTAANMNAEIRDRMNKLFGGVSGDSDADVPHKHLSGTFASRPAAGTAGRFYYATDLGATFVDDGAVWHVSSHVPAICDRDYTDFHATHLGAADSTPDAPSGSPFTVTGEAPGGWQLAYNVATGNAAMDGTTLHSYIELATGASTNGNAHLSPRLDGDAYIASASGIAWPLVWECAVRMVDTVSVDYHFGIVSSISIARAPTPNSSIMFRVQDTGNVFSVTRDNGGTETTTDMTATPTGTNIDLFRIEVASATSAVFTFWKGGLGGTKFTQTHTTAIPATDKLHPGFGVRTNTTAAKQIAIDYSDLLFVRSY